MGTSVSALPNTVRPIFWTANLCPIADMMPIWHGPASATGGFAAALRARRDPGGEDVLEAYRQSRRLDVMSRAYGVDLLSRSLLTSLPPLQAARGLVLHGLKALPPLRRAVMRVGLEPPTALPSLMRPLA